MLSLLCDDESLDSIVEIRNGGAAAKKEVKRQLSCNAPFPSALHQQEVKLSTHAVLVTLLLPLTSNNGNHIQVPLNKHDHAFHGVGQKGEASFSFCGIHLLDQHCPSVKVSKTSRIAKETMACEVDSCSFCIKMFAYTWQNTPQERSLLLIALV